MGNIFRHRVAYHSIIWILGLAFFTLIVYAGSGDVNLLNSVKQALISVLPMSVIVYINFFLKTKLLDKRHYTFYVVAMLGLIIFGVLLFNGLQLLGHFENNNTFNHIVNILFIIVCSTGLQYLKRGIVNQYQLQELKVKTVENELNALKAQLNPHFLFNTLNNIYGMNQINSEVGSEMIMELSQLMRYHLDSSRTDLVLLSSELDLLDSYIKLENLRLPDLHTSSFVQDSIQGNKKIAPLILLPFVENAYKHGTHSTKESFVDIKCYMESNTFHFQVRNSLIEKKNVVKTNIGLENTERRLELIYGSRYTLKVNKSQSTYEVNLRLEL